MFPFILFSSVDEEKIKELEETRVVIHSDGLIVWSRPIRIHFACRMSLTSFPFDRQNCTLRYGSWSYDGTRIDLNIPPIGHAKAFDVTTEFHKNGEWRLLSTDIILKIAKYGTVPWPELYFSFQIERKATFYVATLLVPYYVISGLSCVVFFIQPEAGEKVNLAITTLLSLVVFNEYVESIVPPSADNFPLLGKFIYSECQKVFMQTRKMLIPTVTLIVVYLIILKQV